MDNQFSILNSQLPTAPRSALVAMSGGVDSTVAAVLMLHDGFDCAGATMKLHHRCAEGVAEARAAARLLGIPLHVFDFTDYFSGQVIDRFVQAYLEGRTPNPCIECNRRVKFGRLLDKALELGKDCIVTGHYARTERGADGRFLLKKAADASKDQSYVLYSLTQDQLARARFPLGGLSKQQVRGLASDAGFTNADKSESQDICFVPDGDYANLIALRSGARPRKGRFVDENGSYLGDHDGIFHYTIGQRRGMGLAMPYPAYVLSLRPRDDTVVVGRNEMLYSTSFMINDINLIAVDKLNSPVRARVKIRYKHSGQPATVDQVDDDSIRVVFDEPQRAITKGQAAVIYDGDIVVGGGTIA